MLIFVARLLTLLLSYSRLFPVVHPESEATAHMCLVHPKIVWKLALGDGLTGIVGLAPRFRMTRSLIAKIAFTPHFVFAACFPRPRD
jgi:hypothetical protein